MNRRLKYSKFEDAIIMSGVEEHGRNWSAILAGAGDYLAEKSEDSIRRCR